MAAEAEDPDGRCPAGPYGVTAGSGVPAVTGTDEVAGGAGRTGGMAVEATEKCSLLREVPEVSRLRRRRCPHRVPR